MASWLVPEIVQSGQVVIYNARFDAQFSPGGLNLVRAIECAMLRFAAAHGRHWQKLDAAGPNVVQA